MTLNKVAPLSCDTENFCIYLETYQGIVAGTRTGSFVTVTPEQLQTPETKMHDQYAWAAFNFLVYVIAFCLLLSFIYIGVAWLYDRWQYWQDNETREINRLRDRICELEKKTFASKGEPNAS